MKKNLLECMKTENFTAEELKWFEECGTELEAYEKLLWSIYNDNIEYMSDEENVNFQKNIIMIKTIRERKQRES